MPGLVAWSDAHLTGIQDGLDLILWSGNILSGTLVMKIVDRLSDRLNMTIVVD